MQLIEGQQAPNFSLPTEPDGLITLDHFEGQYLVLYFYPKDDTPGCTTQALDFTAAEDAFASRGARVLGVSRDSIAKHARFRHKHALSVTLGADDQGTVTQAYGVWVEKQLYGRKYMGIERATFLIGPDKLIKKVWRQVKPKDHIADILTTLDALKGI